MSDKNLVGVSKKLENIAGLHGFKKIIQNMFFNLPKNNSQKTKSNLDLLTEFNKLYPNYKSDRRNSYKNLILQNKHTFFMSLKINLQQFWQFLLANTAISAILLFTLLVSATTVTAQNISTDNNGKMEGFKPDENSFVTALNSCNLDIKYPKKVAGQEVFTMIEDKTELAKNKNLSLGWSSGPLAYQHFIFNDNIENPNVDYNYTFVCYDFELIKSEVLNVENILVSFTTFAGLKYEDQYKSELGKRLKREYESKKLSKVEFTNLTKWELGKYDFDYIFLHTAKPISELGENNENFVASFLELKHKDKVYFFSFYPYNYNTESNKRDSLDSKLTQNPYQLFNLEFSSQVKSQYSNDQNIYNFSSTGDNGQLFLLNSVSFLLNYGSYLFLGILFIIILFSAYLSFYLKKSGKLETISNFKLFNFLTTLNIFVLTVIFSPLSFALDQFQYQNLSAFQTGLFFAPLTLWLVFEFLVLLVWVIKNLIQKKFKKAILYLIFTIIMFSPAWAASILILLTYIPISYDIVFNTYLFILTISLLIFHFLSLNGETKM
jgi:hypothetical protein